MKVKITAVTNTGKERTNNEDAYLLCPDILLQDWTQDGTSSYIPLNKYGSVFVVADGMGGANAGEVASALATNSVRRAFSKEKVENALKEGNIEGILQSCIKEADAAINKRICEDPDTFGMGTTIVVCWVIDNTAHVAWCGDSRCYVYNPYKGLRQLTKDHSLVQELIDKGEITEEEAFTHPDNNVITRGLGDFDSQSIPEIIKYPLRGNDIILLCSDGLCGYCTNKEIEKVIEKYNTDITKCRDELMKLALDEGGYDNICIVLASLIGDSQSVPSSLSKWQIMVTRFKQIMKGKL